MAFRVYMIWAPTFSLISSLTSSPLLYFGLTSSLIFQPSQAHSYLRALEVSISSAWNTENYIVHALISVKLLFRCHFIEEFFPIIGAFAFITFCTFKWFIFSFRTYKQHDILCLFICALSAFRP